MVANADGDRESIEDHKRALIHPVAMLYGVRRMSGDQARAKAKQAYGQLITRRSRAGSWFATNRWRSNAHHPSSEERNARFAVVVVGLNASESAIEEARYLQAHALLRQEIGDRG
jgi:hypothetical protein